MQMGKSEGYSGKRDGQRGKERDKAVREEGITERGANPLSDREGWRATEAVLGNLMGERFQGVFQGFCVVRNAMPSSVFPQSVW